MQSPVIRGLDKWKAAHKVTLTRDDGGRVSFADGLANDYHLMMLTDPNLNGALIRLNLALEVAIDCDTELYVNHWGGIDICRIDPHTGAVLDSGRCSKLLVTKEGNGQIMYVEATFFNTHGSILIGSAKGPGGRYTGSGCTQFVFFDAVLEVLEPLELARRVRLVDVGAAGGLQDHWLSRASQIVPVAFEPSPSAALLIRSQIESFEDGILLEMGLFNNDGPQKLNVTRHPGCSSIREPNSALLSRYALAPMFEVVGHLEVQCRRYDTLFAEGLVPRPDVIKVDVQGVELEVLEGFGDLLLDVLGVELEVHVYPVYDGQALLGTIVKYLDDYGLSLRRLQPQHNFDGELVEFNAFFTRRTVGLASPAEFTLEKLILIEQAWQLVVYPQGAQLAAQFVKQPAG